MDGSNIQQVVGMTRKQFFFFFIFAILTGGASFGVGYLSAFKTKVDKNNSFNNQEAQAGQQNSGSSTGGCISNIGSAIANTASNVTSNIISGNGGFIYNGNVMSSDLMGCFISFGQYKDNALAQLVVDNLKKMGKKAHIKICGESYVVYAGPYSSQSLAEAELTSIQLSSNYLSGSIVGFLPS